ncbi:HlyD family secretion protein [Limoniibacter endophyticus]|uniref:Transporter n=1 Tax=Limoniibacter endophyticus TaxID=1565040 RepID=A0A8J3GFF7_9HYPH|nr:HlyD family secretion protein [Limoniibacter endophyticus]GHC66733.1 transporter [Limoniibacter endophyticus]
MNKTFRTASIIAVLIGVLGVILILFAWRLPPFSPALQTTDNAYIRGRVTTLAPQLSGYVAEVIVKDFETVQAGQLLVRVDDRIYRQKLEQAKASLASQQAALANSDQSRLTGEANVASAKAQLEGARVALDTAKAEWARIEPLLARGVTTQSAADQSRSALAKAQAAFGEATAQLQVAEQSLQSTIVNRSSLEAAVEGAQAAVRLAEIDLENTNIRAPEDGKLGEVGVRLGQYVAAGTQLMAIVPHDIWVTANFKETQLYGMRSGQPVRFTVDALNDVEMTGRIERFSPAAGSEFSILKPDNATGNFVKIAQRVAVRIAVDSDQPQIERLAPGMSVVVSVDTSAE